MLVKGQNEPKVTESEKSSNFSLMILEELCNLLELTAMKAKRGAQISSTET